MGSRLFDVKSLCRAEGRQEVMAVEAEMLFSLRILRSTLFSTFATTRVTSLSVVPTVKGQIGRVGQERI
jgi:hypothetical protein